MLFLAAVIPLQLLNSIFISLKQIGGFELSIADRKNRLVEPTLLQSSGVEAHISPCAAASLEPH